MKKAYIVTGMLLSLLPCFASDNNPMDLIEQHRFNEAIPILIHCIQRGAFAEALPLLEAGFQEAVDHPEAKKVIGILLAQARCAVGQQMHNPQLFDGGIALFTIYDPTYKNNSRTILTAIDGWGDIFAMIEAWNEKNRQRLANHKPPYDLYLESFRRKVAAIINRMKVAGEVFNDPAHLATYTTIKPLISVIKSNYLFKSPKTPYIIPDEESLQKCKCIIDAIHREGKIPVALTWMSGAPDKDGVEKPVLAAGCVGLTRPRSIYAAVFTQIAKRCLNDIRFVVTQGPPDHIMTTEEFSALPEDTHKRNAKNLLIADDEFSVMDEDKQQQYRQCRTPIRKNNLRDMFVFIADDPEKPFDATIAAQGLCPLALTTDTLNLWLIEAIKTNLPIDTQRTGICCIPKDESGTSSNVDWRHITGQPLSEGPQSRWHDRVRTFEIDPSQKHEIKKVAEAFTQMVETYKASKQQN